MSSKILVTGATGTMGKALVQNLLSKGLAFEAAVRDIERAKVQLGMSDHLVYFDFEDPSSFEKATEGVDSVFLLGPPFNLEIVNLLFPFIDFLKEKNIKKVVYLSALGELIMKNLPWHIAIAEKLHNDDFDYTVLKPSVFSQNFKTYAGDMIMKDNIIFVTAGEGHVGFVDADDVAEVASIVLTNDGHSGKTYALTGPEAYTFYDAAEILTEITGMPIFYPNPTDEQFIAGLTAAGIPDHMIQYMLRAYGMMANNNTDILNSVVEQITGKKPSSLKDVLIRDFAS
ncbi:SDR family oxidoreductase [Dyadobacter psychrotolerans]|uniref:SDR family oxidoreductase n=1 Tax=Dyadobacter psychrotolerans TaxID=2541721 RepID=A0A4R5DVL4_9BACT|nr:SDR family oxidoreductase [Dyadobacter psychrotolerans]TDE16594.1 SDR family oxidoreductase [Dyadobacter psychrotolerans]